mgnify:CR=1 FL=1
MSNLRLLWVISSRDEKQWNSDILDAMKTRDSYTQNWYRYTDNTLKEVNRLAERVWKIDWANSFCDLIVSYERTRFVRILVEYEIGTTDYKIKEIKYPKIKSGYSKNPVNLDSWIASKRWYTTTIHHGNNLSFCIEYSPETLSIRQHIIKQTKHAESFTLFDKDLNLKKYRYDA